MEEEWKGRGNEKGDRKGRRDEGVCPQFQLLDPSVSDDDM